jgi:EAL and modified HD-GYP domain-containing signal transduction protein
VEGGIQLFIARQPILNRNLNLYGYELLFRSNNETNTFGDDASSTIATATVIGDLYETGIKHMVDEKKAFINFDYDFLMSDTIELLNPNAIIVEVLEDVNVDLALINRLKDLRSKGYIIALDDFVSDYATYPLVPLANIIKFDLMETPLNRIQNEVKAALKQQKIILAEKVETIDEFLLAKEMGFHLFQGYFFSKPNIVHKTNMKKSTKSQYLRLLDELRKEEPSYQSLAEIVETDVNLSFRLMKIIKNRKNEDCDIYSIKRALVCMGFKELEQWVNILMLQELTMNKPLELLKLSLVRSKFGEFIAIHSKFVKRKLEISMMCLFSTIDAILDEPMEVAISEIELPSDVKDTLICKDNELSSIHWLIVAYEHGNWEKVKFNSECIGICQEILQKGYRKAVERADEIMSKL